MIPPAALLLGGNVSLGLAAALVWGGGDFAGGMAVKHAGGSLRAALRVVLLSHALSLTALLLLSLLHHAILPHGAPIAWGLLAGLFGGISVVAFYVCLARGAMGSSAAISGLLAAAIPSVVSSVLEGAPGTWRILGFFLAAVAIWLVATTPGASSVAGGTFALSIISGVGFGLYFVALRMAGVAGVIWPLALSRSMSISVCLSGTLWMALAGSAADRPSDQPSAAASVTLPRGAIVWIFATALLDTGGNVLFIGATRAGRLDVAAVLSSLYPASTILLAAWLLRERFSARQGVGMAVAAVAVVLVTL